MPQERTREELAIPVKVTANVTATWNGKEYDLNEGIKIARGVAEFWQSKYPNDIFVIEDIAPTLPPMGEIVDPLAANGRGEAFAGLKKTKSKAVE